jgi:hypothetical protein
MTVLMAAWGLFYALIAVLRGGMAVLPVWLDPEMQEEDGWADGWLGVARCGLEAVMGMEMGRICLRCMDMISVGAISKTRGI